MAVTASMFTNAVKGFVNGTYTWKTSGGSAYKVALVGAGWTPNQDGNDFWDDISANEIASGNGYTTGGASLVTLDATVDTASNETRLDANDVTWSNSTITASYAVIYQSTGTASTSAVIGWIDFGGAQSSVAADFTIQWAATGVFKFTVS